MKSLKIMLIASAVFATVASADCCVITKCWNEDVKLVPYQACETVCVPVTDACGNIVCYKNVSQCVTKYKKVVVKTPISCCNCCN